MQKLFSLNSRGWTIAACLLSAAICTAAGADNTPPYDVAQLDLRPALMQSVQPDYPKALEKDGIEGSATIEFIIDTDGRVSQTWLISASDPAFATAAEAAARLWIFKPGQVKGRPVKVRVSQEVDFSLDDMKTIRMKILRQKNEDPAFPGFDWDTPPSLSREYSPIVYPFAALRDKVAGRAVVRFVVDLDGRIKQPTIVESTAPEFGQAVIASLEATLFTPAQKKDERRRAVVEASVDFKPDGKGDVLVRASAAAILKRLEKNPAEIVPLRALDGTPKLIKKITPVYPGTLSSSNRQGSAVIEFFIDRGGHAQLPHVLSCTAPEFGHAAALAVNDWIFEAPKKDKKKVVARVQIPIEFALPSPAPKRQQ